MRKKHHPISTLIVPDLRSGATGSLRIVLPAGIAPHPLADHLSTSPGTEPSPLPVKKAHLVKPPKAKKPKKVSTKKKSTRKPKASASLSSSLLAGASDAFDQLQPGSYQRLGGF